MSELKAIDSATAVIEKVYLVYRKSEADRYINWIKYKRCLAMQYICLCELDFAFRDPCIERSVKGCVFWRKWANRWLSLADKLKEAK